MQPLFDKNGAPIAPLIRLLQLMGVEHDGTKTGVRDATQRVWFQEGLLRAQIKEGHGLQRDQALPLLRELGMIDAIDAPDPTHEFSHALVLGATVTAVRKRLALLKRQWDQGVRFFTPVLLGSERSLIAGKEDPKVLYDPNNGHIAFKEGWESSLRNEELLAGNPPRHEAEMMELVLFQSALPDVWKANHDIICAPKKGDRNPNTGDTIKAWLTMLEAMELGEPLSLDLLIVSSQPYTAYQELAVRAALQKAGRKDVKLTSIGYAAPNLPLSNHLDNLTKTIFELCKEQDAET